MNTPTDTFNDMNLFILFMRTYFYNQNQNIIESHLKEYLPSVSSISWDPYNYEYKVKCNVTDFIRDYNPPIQRALLDSFVEGHLNPKLFKDNVQTQQEFEKLLSTWSNIMNSTETAFKYTPMLYRYILLPQSKIISIML